MLNTRQVAALAASAILMASGAAFAADYGSTPSASAPAASKQTKTQKVVTHTPESLQCSKEADTRGLHGKNREKFRSSCKDALRHHKPIPEFKS